MTYKKSMISLVAAGAIAAMVTGCGGSSSSGTTTTNTTTAVTSVEAVDGKILNATVTATYVDDNNVSHDIPLDHAGTYKDVVTGKTTKATSFAYTIADTNLSIADKVRYITVTQKAAAVKDGKSYPASFIDVDLSGDYNSSIDQPYNLTLVAPKGVKYASPVSTLVYNLVQTNLADPTKEVNATEIENALTKISKKLNISVDDIKNVDPLAKTEYGFVNAMLGAANLNALATALDTEDANATDFASTIDLLAKYDATFKGVQASIKTGALKVENLSTLNFDKTRENGGTPVLQEGSTTAIGDINSTTIDGIDVSDLINTGDKIQTGLIKLTFADGKATDANATAKVDLLISVANPEESVEATAKQDKIVIKVSGLDVKRVNGTTTLEYNASTATTSYEWYNTSTSLDKNYVSMSDKNSTELNIGSAFAQNQFNIATLVDLIDTNASGETNTSSATVNILNNIADVTVAIADPDGALQSVNSNGDAELWTTSTVAGTGNVIVAQGKRILDLKADSRGTIATQTNNAPTSAITSNGGTTGLDNTATPTVIATGSSVEGKALVYNYGQGLVTELFTSTVTGDAGEVNATTTISGLPTWIKATSSTITQPATDLNLTVDTNATVTGHNKTLATLSFKDEFGKTDSANDENVTFMFNHAPVAVSATTPRIDQNSTTGATLSTVTTVALSDPDGIADLNASASNLDDIIFVNGSNVITLSDGNTTTVNGALQDNGTIIWTLGHPSTSNASGTATASVIYKVKDIYGLISAEGNYTFDINTTAQ